MTVPGNNQILWRYTAGYGTLIDAGLLHVGFISMQFPLFITYFCYMQESCHYILKTKDIN